MADTTRRARPPGRQLLANALRLSLVLIVLSGLLIAVIGYALVEFPVWQAISFAILGAFLQTAVLGLIYEVFLRNEVEDATLEKLGTARDVREHGLVRIGREATIDWSVVLESTKELCIVTHDPRGLLGRFDDQILRRAAEGYLNRLTIVVPQGQWNDAESWLVHLRDKWEKTAPLSEFYAVKSEASPAYEFIGTDYRFIILLPSLCDAPGVEARKLLDFKQSESEPWGIGSWLARQLNGLVELKGTIGHSPPPPRPKVGADTVGDEDSSTSDSEELT